MYSIITPNIDVYKTFVELTGAKLPKNMQPLEGSSLLPLLESKNANWEDRLLFTHCGRWKTGKVNEAKYVKMAIRSQQWRFVNNKELYDVAKDPGETKDVAATNPEVITKFKQPYDVWWNNSIPLMVNENRKKIKEQPLHLKYYKQLEEEGIPFWSPELSIKSNN